MNTTLAQTPNTRPFRIAFAVVALALLAVPLIAMQFTSEVNWTAFDFAFGAAMFLALGVVIELAIRFIRGRWARAIGIALAITGFIFVWGMLATA